MRRVNLTDPPQNKWLTCHDMIFDQENGCASTFVNPYANSAKAGSTFWMQIISLFKDAKLAHEKLSKAKSSIPIGLIKMNNIRVAYNAMCAAKTSKSGKRKAEKDLLAENMEAYKEEQGARPSRLQPQTSDLSFAPTTVSGLLSPVFGVTPRLSPVPTSGGSSSKKNDAQIADS